MVKEGSTSTPNGPTDKEKCKPFKSEKTEDTMMKKSSEYLRQQNKARHMDSAEAEKLIKKTANSCEDNVRS